MFRKTEILREESKMEKLVGQDKGRDITYQQPLLPEQPLFVKIKIVN